ncbi:transcription-repair coupling factor [Amphiplicatus metriothermophilus]|uniref:Transcription-repair-coupling factor n=1 Tax=Amphiplicatus metriothermophilus TaxID=1519374 RepID=A0A239PPY6_9PROT|nr:transcription-repair coupling factor [Amphiplicatus metriothermophilus]MBB5518634.1 transcription-repair coupling factor (superfamily II helicase) [Amphiplicatus metriothermophilus]SNT72208.1 transcription-repair coupling factor [Amphiplicatus metriothermophilus]
MTVISGTARISAEEAWSAKGALDVYGAPEGADAMAVAAAARARGGLVVHIARDGARAAAMAEALRFFAPDIPTLVFPAWDCLPYDRVSPSAAVASARMATLALLARHRGRGPLIVATSVNAAVQRTPPRAVVADAALSIGQGEAIGMEPIAAYLAANGYERAGTVREPGEFAVRGGLIDLFPPGAEEPIRLDFFGDQIDSIRAFDPATQRTTRQLRAIDLAPATEVLLTEESISRFRSGYVAEFGPAGDDPVYEAASAGRKHAGMEHWLPLFYPKLDTLFDFAEGGLVFLEHLAAEAADERFAAVADHYAARVEDADLRRPKNSAFAAPAYRPLKPEALYLSADEWRARLAEGDLRRLSPFAPPEGRRAFDFGAKVGRSFAAERAAEKVNVFDAVREHAETLLREGKCVFIACWSEGSAERMASVLADHGLGALARYESWPDAQKESARTVSTIVLGLETGFVTPDAAFISEQDILGDRLVRRTRKKRAENFLAEASSLLVGDLVVHVDHGVGRYAGLKTLDVQGAPHDCLQIEYAGGDRLFLPVENIELLSRFGSDDPAAPLDKLGGAGWQSRKAKMRARIKMLAEQLIAIAAKREMKSAEAIAPPDGAYDEFCARFPFTETEDQENAIADVIEDLARGRPMDRLICGDVGFGKTEVALRAAFVVAMSGRQVAVIAPTTLLARQHYKNFSERFKGFPVRVAQLSRFVSASDAAATRAGLADGTVDIVIGTHALLAKTVRFRDLGLLIIDEEQHFGVKHKERLKEYRADTHVLTLTATPIPRTLQLAMSGIRDLSLIATPPADRLAVRTTVGPFDPVVARETLLREHYRGGQSFYIAPRIADLESVAEFLRESVPEVRFKVAHGQMSSGELEDIMTAFYEGKFEVLVSTTIIESGLDIPTANTLIVHRADRFGLAQLYQLRGRVGRSKLRAYAYLTTSPRGELTPGAERRLKVMQSLDTLGAGFTLASHDLDLRGAGNLLGEEQSGHAKEVGVELYQHMLEEAVASLREGAGAAEETWSPQINIGAAVLIPDHYVADLDVRMGLYRRLGALTEQTEIEAFAAELIDRFGPLPKEVEQLLQIVAIKGVCLRAGVAKVDAGPKGAVITFRNDTFANPAGLVSYISSAPLDVKLRPDQKLVFRQEWPDERARLKGCMRILDTLQEIAREAA